MCCLSPSCTTCSIMLASLMDGLTSSLRLERSAYLPSTTYFNAPVHSTRRLQVANHPTTHACPGLDLEFWITTAAHLAVLGWRYHYPPLRP